jgi:hypothetical protein
MANIFARSPYIISVNETGQEGSKIEIFLWNGTSEPSPNNAKYTLSKLIPASNNTLTTYDISPYIREYLSFATRQDPTAITALNTSQWCNVRIKRYKLDVTTYTLLDTTNYYALDGYTYYESGSNVDLGKCLLEPKTYYYNAGTYSGQINTYLFYDSLYVSDYIVYTKPDLSASITLNTTSSGWKCVPRVHPSYTATGNKVQIYSVFDGLLATYTFLPICEPKYTPVVIDFINQYGAWQREFFFKASKNTLAIESNDYNVMQSSITSYDILQGQKKSFNTNAKETISVNSGYVNEDFSSNIKQLLMSERVLVDNKPAICKTKSLELMKNINNHMINYSLEFELAYNTINAVI